MKTPVAMVFTALATFTASALAGPATPGLPAEEIIAGVLKANPGVLAARSQIQVEEANQRRLNAGPYEWNMRVGGGQRRVTPSLGPDERFNEWNAAIERPLRLPGKATTDAELGTTALALAESAYGDALHEAGRSLLKSWFSWLKESAAAEQWTAQVALLEKQSRGIERRQQLGDAAKLEAIQAQAAVAQAQAQLIQARLRERTILEELKRRYPGLPLTGPSSIPEPQAITGSEGEWVERITARSHELALARRETQLAELSASRHHQDRLPDPSVGIHFSRERAGEENIVSAYVSIPLPGDARRATADAGIAKAEAAARQELAVAQKIGAEAAGLYHAAVASLAAWQSAQDAARRLVQAADMTARSYQLGEGTLSDLLAARRLSNEAELAARLSQLDALELGYRLLIDGHILWDFD